MFVCYLKLMTTVFKNSIYKVIQIISPEKFKTGIKNFSKPSGSLVINKDYFARFGLITQKSCECLNYFSKKKILIVLRQIPKHVLCYFGLGAIPS